MVDIKSLMEKAKVYKLKGFSEKEIADELHLSIDTVSWLLSAGVESAGYPPSDVKIGWRSVGVYGSRIDALSNIMVDIINETVKNKNESFDSVVGVAVNGIPFATLISVKMNKELIVYRPASEIKKLGSGAISSNYADWKDKSMVIVDDVIGTGYTIGGLINEAREHGAKPVLALVIVNKSSMNEINGVPLRALIRARSMGGTILGGGPLISFPYA